MSAAAAEDQTLSASTTSSSGLAYCSIPLPLIGKLDHLAVLLLCAYKQRLSSGEEDCTELVKGGRGVT